MAGRHAKRTAVTLHIDEELGTAWRIDFATFDQPGSTIVYGPHSTALDVAQRYEAIKARARFVEARRRAGEQAVAALTVRIGTLTPREVVEARRQELIAARRQARRAELTEFLDDEGVG